MRGPSCVGFGVIQPAVARNRIYGEQSDGILCKAKLRREALCSRGDELRFSGCRIGRMAASLADRLLRHLKQQNALCLRSHSQRGIVADSCFYLQLCAGALPVFCHKPGFAQGSLLDASLHPTWCIRCTCLGGHPPFWDACKSNPAEESFCT